MFLGCPNLQIENFGILEHDSRMLRSSIWCLSGGAECGKEHLLLEFDVFRSQNIKLIGLNTLHHVPECW